MKQRLHTIKEFLIDHKKDVIIDGLIGLGVLLVIALIAVFIYNNQPPKIVYEPDDACDMLTLAKAKQLLGYQAVKGNDTGVVVTTANTTNSQCSYSDLNPDANGVKVTAISIQSGINDTGTAQNKTNFTSSAKGNENVTGFGDVAFFNTSNGQLNILDGHSWIILSYGLGSSPTSNTLSDDEMLAKLVLN